MNISQLAFHAVVGFVTEAALTTAAAATGALVASRWVGKQIYPIATTDDYYHPNVGLDIERAPYAALSAVGKIARIALMALVGVLSAVICGGGVAGVFLGIPLPSVPVVQSAIAMMVSMGAIIGISHDPTVGVGAWYRLAL